MQYCIGIEYGFQQRQSRNWNYLPNYLPQKEESYLHAINKKHLVTNKAEDNRLFKLDVCFASPWFQTMWCYPREEFLSTVVLCKCMCMRDFWRDRQYSYFFLSCLLLLFYCPIWLNQCISVADGKERRVKNQLIVGLPRCNMNSKVNVREEE